MKKSILYVFELLTQNDLYPNEPLQSFTSTLERINTSCYEYSMIIVVKNSSYNSEGSQ
jgi:hypothetical protein